MAKPGRKVMCRVLPDLIQEISPDFVIANVENICHGDGFKPEHISEMRELGVDFFTTGNHAFKNKEGVKMFAEKDFPVIRPANFPEGVGVPGSGHRLVEAKNGKNILVVNLMGRVFMKESLDCPFLKMDSILADLAKEKQKPAAIFLDFHAEATSEKYALAFYLDGRVGAIVGTHTHVATRDARILPGGTAAISDVGMVGPLDSVIGVKKEQVIQSFLTQLSFKYEPEEMGRMIFNAILISLDPKTGKALNAQHVQKIFES